MSVIQMEPRRHRATHSLDGILWLLVSNSNGAKEAHSNSHTGWNFMAACQQFQWSQGGTQQLTVKSMPKYRGNGCWSAGKRGKVPRSVLGSWICVGRRAWLQPGGCALMGCRCPISDGQGWAKAQPGRARTGTKRETGYCEEYLILWLKSPIYYRGLYIVIDKQ